MLCNRSDGPQVLKLIIRHRLLPGREAPRAVRWWFCANQRAQINCVCDGRMLAQQCEMQLCGFQSDPCPIGRYFSSWGVLNSESRSLPMSDGACKIVPPNPENASRPVPDVQHSRPVPCAGKSIFTAGNGYPLSLGQVRWWRGLYPKEKQT